MRLDGYAPLGGDGVLGVDTEIDEDLVDLGRIYPHLPGNGGRHPGKADVLADEAADHLQQALHEVVDDDDLRGDGLLAGEGQQLPGEVRRVAGGLPDLGDVFAQRAVLVEPFFEELGKAENDAELIVEVMGHPAGKAPHRLHLLRLQQLFGEPLPVLLGLPASGDVSIDALVHDAAGHLDARAGGLHPADLAVLADDAEVVPGRLDAVLHPLAQALLDKADIIGMNQSPDFRTAHGGELLHGVAEKLDKGRVDETKPGWHLLHDGNGVHGLRKEQPIAQLGVADGVLQAFLLGDIAGNAEDPADHALMVADRSFDHRPYPAAAIQRLHFLGVVADGRTIHDLTVLHGHPGGHRGGEICAVILAEDVLHRPADIPGGTAVAEQIAALAIFDVNGVRGRLDQGFEQTFLFGLPGLDARQPQQEHQRRGKREKP